MFLLVPVHPGSPVQRAVIYCVCVLCVRVHVRVRVHVSSSQNIGKFNARTVNFISSQLTDVLMLIMWWHKYAGIIQRHLR